MFTLTIQVSDLAELESFVAALKHSVSRAIVHQVETAASDALTATAIGSTNETTVSTRGRGRPKKQPEADQSKSVASGAVDKTPPSGELFHSIDDARAALQALVSTAGKGMEAGFAVLKQFGAQRISDVKADQYRDFITACKAA